MAAFPWNGWQLCRGIGGRIGLEYAAVIGKPIRGYQEILRYANDQGRILVTLDKGFGERAIVFGEPHHGIIRLVGIAAREQARYCLAVLNKYEPELASGAIVTVDSSRTRVRLAD